MLLWLWPNRCCGCPMIRSRTRSGSPTRPLADRARRSAGVPVTANHRGAPRMDTGWHGRKAATRSTEIDARLSEWRQRLDSVECTEPYDHHRHNGANKGNRQNGYYASTYDAAARIDRGGLFCHGFPFSAVYSGRLATGPFEVQLLSPGAAGAPQPNEGERLNAPSAVKKTLS